MKIAASNAMNIASNDALISDSRKIVAQHQPIIDAILTRDEFEARRLAEQHNPSEGEKLSTHLKNLQRSRGNPLVGDALSESTKPRERKSNKNHRHITATDWSTKYLIFGIRREYSIARIARGQSVPDWLLTGNIVTDRKWPTV